MSKPTMGLHHLTAHSVAPDPEAPGPHPTAGIPVPSPQTRDPFS